MSKWNELAHFLYSPEFWYADPLREIRGLTEEQLLWVPETKSLCALWHAGHVAHRERLRRWLRRYQDLMLSYRELNALPTALIVESMSSSVWLSDTKAASN